MDNPPNDTTRNISFDDGSLAIVQDFARESGINTLSGTVRFIIYDWRASCRKHSKKPPTGKHQPKRSTTA